MPQTQENSLPHFRKIKCRFFGKSTCRLQMNAMDIPASEKPLYARSVEHAISLQETNV